MKALAASVAPWIKRLYSQNSINKLIALFCKLAICNPAIPVREGDFTKKGAGERNYSSEVLLHQREKTTGNMYAPCVCKKNIFDTKVGQKRFLQCGAHICTLLKIKGSIHKVFHTSHFYLEERQSLHLHPPRVFPPFSVLEWQYVMDCGSTFLFLV